MQTRDAKGRILDENILLRDRLTDTNDDLNHIRMEYRELSDRNEGLEKRYDVEKAQNAIFEKQHEAMMHRSRQGKPVP